MKTKEYVKKYNLQSNKPFNHSHFVEDLTLDFMAQLELGRKGDGSYNIKGYENAINGIRQKWEGIHNKTIPGLPEKLWRYFYATVLAKIRNEMFPDEMARRKRAKEEYEERKKFEYGFDDMFENMFRDSWQDFIFDKILTSFASAAPVAEFQILGLESEASIEDVKVTYKTLAKTHHPDKGGKQEMFVKITTAKNKCLAYLNNK
jgi:hypothetical protein